MDFSMNPRTKRGWIELITGCMFAGKTEEFIRRIKRYQYGKQNCLVFKPVIDDRYSKENVFSHSGMKIEAMPVDGSGAIEELVLEMNSKNPDNPVTVVGIDEVQFFDTGILEVLEKFADNGMICIVNGLDKDFKCDPFQNVYQLLAQAEYVDKLTSICHVCGGNANRTQRIINGKPAKANEPIVVVSADDKYEARCRHCYIRPK